MVHCITLELIVPCMTSQNMEFADPGKQRGWVGGGGDKLVIVVCQGHSKQANQHKSCDEQQQAKSRTRAQSAVVLTQFLGNYVRINRRGQECK